MSRVFAVFSFICERGISNSCNLVPETLSESEGRVTHFVQELRHRYPKELSGEHMNVDVIFDVILHSTVLWNLTGTLALAANPAPLPGHHIHFPSTSGHVTHIRHSGHNRTRQSRQMAAVDANRLSRGITHETLAGELLGANTANNEMVKGISFYDILHARMGVYNASLDNYTGVGGNLVGFGGTHSDQKDGNSSSLGDDGVPSFKFHNSQSHTPQMEIAHKLHYASLAVVSVLLVEVRIPSFQVGVVFSLFFFP